MAQYSLPLEWIYLHHKGARVLTPYLHRVAELVCQGQLHAQYFYGFGPHTIIAPCGIRHVEKALILNKNANSFFLLIMHILVNIILLENYWISYRKLSLYSLIPLFAKDWFIYPMSFVLAYEFLFKSYTFLCERITHGRRDEEKDDLPSTASLAIWSQWLLLCWLKLGPTSIFSSHTWVGDQDLSHSLFVFKHIDTWTESTAIRSGIGAHMECRSIGGVLDSYATVLVSCLWCSVSFMLGLRLMLYLFWMDFTKYVDCFCCYEHSDIISTNLQT